VPEVPTCLQVSRAGGESVILCKQQSIPDLLLHPDTKVILWLLLPISTG
jgi:hypothetical protein